MISNRPETENSEFFRCYLELKLEHFEPLKDFGKGKQRIFLRFQIKITCFFVLKDTM